MSQHLRRLLLFGIGAAVVAIGLGTIGIKLILDYSATHAPTRPVGFVPARFRMVKDSPGHLDHYNFFACRECHGMGEGGFQRPGVELCEECHEQQRVIFHDSPLARDTTNCLTCHRFGDDLQVSPRNCMRCHGLQRGYVAAIEVHSEATCTDCHRVHEGAPAEQRPCVDCHAEQLGHHGARAPKQARTCLDCHRVHDSATAADQRCVACHTTERPTVSTNALFDGHPQCVTCHRPHEFTAESARPCRDCHYAAEVLAAGEVRQHAECTRCHWPHDVKRQATRSCQRCHRKVEPNHPPDARRGPCLGCHPAHPDKALHAGAATCWSCHRNVASETDFHDKRNHSTPCKACHTKHAFASPDNRPEFCVRCHRPQVELSKRGGVHRECSTCHPDAPHAPDLPAVKCAQCHAQQAHSAPPGHAKCERCHADPHDPRRARDATCEKCHKPQAQRNRHAKVDGGCRGCHRAHGPQGVAKPPACTACHDQAALPGLHVVKAHNKECERCHPAHELEVRRDRKSCTEPCHAKQRGHEPSAKVCSGCHPFRGDKPVKPLRSPR